MPGSRQRRLSEPMVEQGVLQDIHPARAAGLGISIGDTGYERDDEDENAMPALDRLRLVRLLCQILPNVWITQACHFYGLLAKIRGLRQL